MSTKTIRVADATNIQLDWLVWKCAGGAGTGQSAPAAHRPSRR